jgi:hypothetical protein
MSIPQAFTRCLGFSLNIPFSVVVICRVPFRLLDFSPAVPQNLGGDIHAPDLGSARVPRDVIVGRKAMRRRK